MLVTHDRYLLDRVSTVVLGLSGQGATGRFADYSQWDAWQAEASQSPRKQLKPKTAAPAPKRKPSYLDTREYEAIEQRVAAADLVVEQKRAALQDPAISKDGRLLEQAYAELEAAQDSLDALYARWAELEQKMA